MKKLSLVEKFVAVLSLVLMIGCVGCGESATDVVGAGQNRNIDSPTPQNPAAVVAAPTQITARTLTGFWLGGAILDEDKFQLKISEMDQQSRNAAANRAKSFLSTEMAMEFRENGTVENEVEILSTDGKLLRDGSVASWQIMESKPNGLLIQTQERLADGTVATDQLFYQFSGDRNRIAINVPVPQELEGCDAMIVFERKTLPPTNVAAGQTGTLTK